MQVLPISISKRTKHAISKEKEKEKEKQTSMLCMFLHNRLFTSSLLFKAYDPAEVRKKALMMIL